MTETAKRQPKRERPLVSVTLDNDIYEAVEVLAKYTGEKKLRSRFFDQAIAFYLRHHRKELEEAIREYYKEHKRFPKFCERKSGRD